MRSPFSSTRVHGVFFVLSLIEALIAYQVSMIAPVPCESVRSGRLVRTSVRRSGAGAVPLESENWLYMKSSVPVGQWKTEGRPEMPSVKALTDGAVMSLRLTRSVA
jgi:hypothetical protein